MQEEARFVPHDEYLESKDERIDLRSMQLCLFNPALWELGVFFSRHSH